MKKKVHNNLSVDCVIFGFENNQLHVMLTKRELVDPKDPGKIILSDYTLQGQHIYIGENLYDAATRILKEKTGLSNIYLEQFHTFGSADRLLREKDQVWLKATFPDISPQVISVAYFSLVDSSLVKPDKKHPETGWFPINDLPDLGFDHPRIINIALEYLRKKILREPIGFELLPEKFTITQLQNLYDSILGINLDKRNFRKKVSQMKFVIPLDEKQQKVPHKPARVHIFSWDVYKKTKEEKPTISL